MPATSAAPVLRATSQYVLAFTAHEGWTLADTLDDLLTVAADSGHIVAGSHNKQGQVSLVLRFPDDDTAVDVAYALSAEVQAPLVGVVTGLGINRRQVAL
jgi:hypothetical protein